MPSYEDVQLPKQLHAGEAVHRYQRSVDEEKDRQVNAGWCQLNQHAICPDQRVRSVGEQALQGLSDAIDTGGDLRTFTSYLKGPAVDGSPAKPFRATVPFEQVAAAHPRGDRSQNGIKGTVTLEIDAQLEARATLHVSSVDAAHKATALHQAGMTLLIHSYFFFDALWKQAETAAP